jgi:coproporphyrinogen III oxidase
MKGRRTGSDEVKADGMAAGRCDDYFFIPARGEHRGVGGIFFDDLVALPSGGPALPLVRAIGEGFMPSYLPIARRRQAAEFTAEQRDWQLLRRGRYLEFNLLYDRGVVRRRPEIKEIKGIEEKKEIKEILDDARG